MVLNLAFAALGLKLQESGIDLTHSDLRKRVGAALRAKNQSRYVDVIDLIGDDSAGEVIYALGYMGDSEYSKAPYVISDVGGVPVCEVDCDAAVDVIPRVIYDELPDEDDATAQMQEAKLYTGDAPVFERLISKAEREKIPAEDFAGKGKSFPIRTSEDVVAAARAIGRAASGNHSPSTLKKNIVAIATRKGFTSSLPKGWQTAAAPATESAQPAAQPAGDRFSLREAAATLDVIRIQEARSDYEIKLIAPGLGSSAFYPAEVLKRDGPKVFKSGTHVYLNHATAAEEAARPEGDVKNLAGVLTTDAQYLEAHAKGPGLYGRMKVFADHAQTVEERAPHVGMSIRASGIREAGKQVEGRPVLKELVHADSVDVVTQAGAGGMILTEAAKGTPTTDLTEGEATMTEQEKAEVQALRESNQRLIVMGLRRDAREIGARLLEGLGLPAVSKARVIESCAGQNVTLPMTATGELDEAKFKLSIEEASKREGEYVAALSGSGRVIGMGVGGAAPVLPTAEEKARMKEAAKEEHEDAVQIFESLGMPKNAAVKAAEGRAN